MCGCINTMEELQLNSMDEVSALMRANLPKGMTPKEFGEVMQWGKGSAVARARMATLTVAELLAAALRLRWQIIGPLPTRRWYV
jgi:hypothetical protein